MKAIIAKRGKVWAYRDIDTKRGYFEDHVDKLFWLNYAVMDKFPPKDLIEDFDTLEEMTSVQDFNPERRGDTFAVFDGANIFPITPELPSFKNILELSMGLYYSLFHEGRAMASLGKFLSQKLEEYGILVGAGAALLGIVFVFMRAV